MALPSAGNPSRFDVFFSRDGFPRYEGTGISRLCLEGGVGTGWRERGKVHSLVPFPHIILPINKLQKIMRERHLC